MKAPAFLVRKLGRLTEKSLTDRAELRFQKRHAAAVAIIEAALALIEKQIRKRTSNPIAREVLLFAMARESRRLARALGTFYLFENCVAAIKAAGKERKTRGRPKSTRKRAA